MDYQRNEVSYSAGYNKGRYGRRFKYSMTDFSDQRSFLEGLRDGRRVAMFLLSLERD